LPITSTFLCPVLPVGADLHARVLTTRAAIVRPDHYVYGVANDTNALGKMLSELATRLQ